MSTGRLRAILPLVVVICAVFAAPRASLADDGPVRPVKIVLAYAAGGSADTVARALAQNPSDAQVQGCYAQTVPVASRNIPPDPCVKAAAAGSTVLSPPEIQFASGPT